MIKLATVVLLAFSAVVLAAPPAFSQEYPAKNVRIIVGFAPGGGNDIVARILGIQFTNMYKRQFIVENRPGAGTIIGVEAVADADPDGYTLLVTNNSLAVNHTLYPKLPYDTLKDIAPIVKAGSTPNVLVIHPSVPAKTTAEFIALAKSQPGKIAYASAGTGSTAFLAAEMFKLLTGTKMLHVPYKGTSPALTSILSGETQAMVRGVAGRGASDQERAAARARGDQRQTRDRHERHPDHDRGRRQGIRIRERGTGCSDRGSCRAT